MGKLTHSRGGSFKEKDWFNRRENRKYLKNNELIEEEDKKVDLILEILEIMNEEVADTKDIKNIMEICLYTKVVSELFTVEQINQ